MLKALRNNGGLLVLGINPKELEHLKQGQPLKVDLTTVGAPGNQVILFLGSSDDEMLKRFQKSPLADDKRLIDVSKVRFQ